MKHAIASIIVLSFSFAAWAGSPPAEIDQAAFYLGNASSELPRACRSVAGTRIHNAYATANQLKASYRANTTAQLEAEVRALVGLVQRHCDAPKTLRHLKNAQVELAGLVTRTPAKAATCWHASDPGCSARKNGHGPMDKQAFDLLIASLQATGYQLAPMKRIYTQGVTSYYLTSMQLAYIVDHFAAAGVDDLSLVGVLQTGVPRLVDPENIGLLHAKVRVGTASARYLGISDSGVELQIQYDAEGYDTYQGYDDH